MCWMIDAGGKDGYGEVTNLTSPSRAALFSVQCGRPILALPPPKTHTIRMPKSMNQRYRRRDSFEDAQPQVTLCNHPGCTEAGLHRAPKSRQKLNEYYWFCLEHVRAYNKSWDYYAGMNQAE